jgi:hypothetical protein
MLLAAVAAAAPLAAQDDKDKAVAGGGTLPAGWSARTDGDVSLANVKFVTMGSGVHATLGPAVILYRTTDAVTGEFHTVATFIQTRAPKHPEAYGLFIGGQALDGPGLKYTYFLVRGDGEFIIKRRNGPADPATIAPWTENAAIAKADANGVAKNELSILVSRGKVSFLVNGKQVYSAAADAVEPKGVVGLRINHNLDVHVDGFAVHRM